MLVVVVMETGLALVIVGMETGGGGGATRKK